MEPDDASADLGGVLKNRSVRGDWYAKARCREVCLKAFGVCRVRGNGGDVREEILRAYGYAGPL
jgi:hypothetical protein